MVFSNSTLEDLKHYVRCVETTRRDPLAVKRSLLLVSMCMTHADEFAV